MKAELTDLELMVHHRTDKAVLVSTDANREAAVWLPLSQVEAEEGIRAGKTQIFTLPQWLAEDKGLV